MGCQLSSDVQSMADNAAANGSAIFVKKPVPPLHDKQRRVSFVDDENSTSDKTNNDREPTADTSLATLSEEAAATIIQASYRGFKSRREQGKQNNNTDTMTEEEAPMDLNDPELEKAATKIQATFKGYKVRQEAGKEKDEKGADEATASAATASAEEAIDIDLTDPDVEKAATKIQATFRGYKTRRQEEKKEDDK